MATTGARAQVPRRERRYPLTRGRRYPVASAGTPSRPRFHPRRSPTLRACLPTRRPSRPSHTRLRRGPKHTRDRAATRSLVRVKHIAAYRCAQEFAGSNCTGRSDGSSSSPTRPHPCAPNARHGGAVAAASQPHRERPRPRTRATGRCPPGRWRCCCKQPQAGDRPILLDLAVCAALAPHTRRVSRRRGRRCPTRSTPCMCWRC
jgi:hypothetical protein